MQALMDVLTVSTLKKKTKLRIKIKKNVKNVNPWIPVLTGVGMRCPSLKDFA